MKQIFKNFKFTIVESDRPRYHKVKTSFIVDGVRHQEFLYIRNNGKKDEQYYIDEAMKQVEKHTGLNLNSRIGVKKVKKNHETPPTKEEIEHYHYKKYYGDKRPAIKVLIVISLVALVCIGLFIWQFFFAKNNSSRGGEKYTTISLLEKTSENIGLIDDKRILIGEDYKIIIKSKKEETGLNINTSKVNYQDEKLSKLMQL